MTGRIKTSLFVEGILRNWSQAGEFHYIIQKGDPDTGTLLIKLSNTRGKAKLLTEMPDIEGNLKWQNVLENDILEEQQADQYILQAKDMDPDLWIIELETKDFQNPFAL